MKKNEMIKGRLEEWIKQKGFLNSRLTIIELCKTIGINRTYLSNYINHTYGLNFNLWLNHLRIEEAKLLMTQPPKRNLSEIAERIGFTDLAHSANNSNFRKGSLRRNGERICNNTQRSGRKSVKITIFVRLNRIIT